MSVISFRARSHAAHAHRSQALPATGAGRRRRGPQPLADVLLGLFGSATLIAMEVSPGEETIPYHLLFLALTLVYGFRVWPLVPTLLVVLLVTVAPCWVMVRHYLDGAIDAPELAEIPLMPMLFVAMVWHARRRVAAQQEVERMADQRRAVLDREREFFRDASHALRTPVTIARGHLELLQTAITQPDEREDLDIAVRQLDRMSALSNRLLALAQLDAGGAIRCRPLDLSRLLDRVGQNWRSSADRHWIVDCPPSGLVPADREWLERALDALIENAVHFTSAEDRIRLSCRPIGGWAVIEVADSGPGVSDEDLPHVFERFWHRPPPAAARGSGLGLAMAMATAQAHGGSLTAGRAPEGGASFTLTLPGFGVPEAVRDPLSEN
jgi:signal transduction histidine kinase